MWHGDSPKVPQSSLRILKGSPRFPQLPLPRWRWHVSNALRVTDPAPMMQATVVFVFFSSAETTSKHIQRIHGTGIFSYLWLIFMENVGKYTIHGFDGISKHIQTINIPSRWWFDIFFSFTSIRGNDPI